MKKFLVTLFALSVASGNFALADGDLWDNFGDSGVYGQKSVTDDEFDKALESKKKKFKKKKNKEIPKGESFSQSNETKMLTETSKDLPILLIPLALKVKEGYTIPIGHYQVEGEKKDGEVYIKLYQAHDLIAKIPAEETEDDFGETSINFVKLLPHGDYHVEIIYGGMDFNAYAIIDTE